MNEHGLTKENLLRSLPISLSGDPKMAALAEAIAGLLARRREEIERLAVYPHIDRLDEGLLDILAHDFKVDWWDSGYSLEEKRRTLGTSWQVHMTLGTKAAVLKAVTSVYPQAALEEWFEYGGEPYHFRLTVRMSDGGWDSSRHRQLIEKMQYYKNLRSHRDAIKYFLPLVTAENMDRFWFEGLLVRGRFPPNRRGLDVPGLLISWSLEERYGTGASLLSRMRGRGRQALESKRLLIGPYSVDVLGLRATYFDGVYRFDGERFFWYTFTRRPAFYSMNIRAGAKQQERISGVALLVPGSAAKNQWSGRPRALYRARDRTGTGIGHENTSVRIPAENKNTAAGFLTQDSMWTFNGAHSFGGERSFNAKIERSEL